MGARHPSDAARGPEGRGPAGGVEPDPACAGGRGADTAIGSAVSPSSDNAAFFLPGLVHQFGNLLLTIQGQALTLDPAGFDRGRSAILAAVQRGADGLQVLRVLLGDALDRKSVV